MPLSLPERILKELGVNEPQDINLQRLYEQCNLTLEYSSDMSADAEIMIAPNHHGIITINQDQHPVRQRFSIAHELGHWHLHKNQAMFVCDTNHGSSRSFFEEQTGKNKERQADRFAADLLMPPYMLKPMVKKQSRIDFCAIKQLSKTFQTSISATAIQIVNIGDHPILIAVYNERGNLLYFQRSALLNEKLWPSKTLSHGMYAFDVVQDKISKKGVVSAHEWFENTDGDIDIFEESHYWHGQILSILTLENISLMAD